MNNKLEGDDLLTCVEPVISYYSTSSNLGVTAIYSKKDIKPYNLKYNSLFTEFSPKNNFSVCNTIMIPFITNESGIYNDNNNYYSCNVSQTTSNLKDKDNSKNSIKIDNTRIKTISSKGENKENEDSPKEDTNMENLEKNPFFLGKNLSLNYVIDKKKEDKLNFKHSQKEIFEDEDVNENDNNNYNTCKFEGDFINRTACKSVNINDLSVKSIYLKEEKKNKSLLYAKKNKKTKIKDLFLNKKIKIKLEKRKDKDKDIIFKKSYKQKSFFLGEQSKSLIEENTNPNNQNLEKALIGVNQTNHSGGNKRKSYYYSNKIVTKNNNENYFKATLKKNNVDKIVEEKEKENDKDKEQNEKTERKKIKKEDCKTPLKNVNNNTTSKFLKIKIQKENNRVIINHQSHTKQGINILKEHIKIKEPDKKDDSPHDHSVNLGKEKSKKEKNKKLRKRKSDNKDNKDSDTEEKKMTKTPNRRASGFSFKKKNKRKNTEKQDNNSDQKTLKTNKTKKDKEKDNISRSNFSLKDSNNNNNNIKAKIKLNNSLTRKDLVLLRNTYDNKDNVERLAKFIRRKRSISVNLDKSILVEVAKTLKENEHDNKTKENTRLKTNTNTNLNTISIGNMGKGKKLNKKNFDFEKALKKNSKKMQFNLFSKDKFTNSEIINSDYLKYTLNCMELIIDIDMEKQTRLKNKINFNFPKPKKKNSIKKRIALFDLDETLVHCTGDIKVKKEKYQHVIEIKLPGKQAVQVGINLRPLWKQTLKLIKKYYHIVIYTASHQAYADSVLDFMDPKKKYFKYRLYRNNCSLIDVEGAKFYVKDLDILNEYYDLKDIVIIDNSVLSFAFHLHNGIPIVPYYDEDKDGSLYVVGLYLNHIFPENDLREANKTQINLDSFLEEAKKLKEEEEENVIDEEPDDEEEEKSINNSNKSDKEKQEGKEKEGQSDDEKKVSDKKVCLNAKRRTCFDFPIDNQRRESHDSTQKKLISHSKLLNMYYEVNDESSKSIKDQISDANLEDKKSVENLNGENNKENGKNNDNAFIVNSGNGEIECKSDPGYPLIDQNNNYNSDNDSVSDDNIPVLKRGFTIIEEPDNKIQNYMITGKLNYIRSNFYNNFKI